MTDESKHGGRRSGAGRKAQDPANPRRPDTLAEVYHRIQVAKPRTDEEGRAWEWFFNLSPDERLRVIVTGYWIGYIG